MSLYGDPQSDSALACGELTSRCVRWQMCEMIVSTTSWNKCNQKVLFRQNLGSEQPNGKIFLVNYLCKWANTIGKLVMNISYYFQVGYYVGRDTYGWLIFI